MALAADKYTLSQDTNFRARIMAIVAEKAAFHQANVGSTATDKALAKVVMANTPAAVVAQFASMAAADATIQAAAIPSNGTVTQVLATDAQIDTLLSAKWTILAQAMGF